MSRHFRTRFGLRSKLVLLSAFLFVLPWLGYQYILEMEEYLSRGQEQVVLGTARALATALSERPELFSGGSFSRAREGVDLYVFPIFYPLAIDDDSLLDWRDYQQYEQTYREGSAEPNLQNRYTTYRNFGSSGDPLRYHLMLGEYNRSLYAYLRVEDRFKVLRSRSSLRLDRGDSLHIALVNRNGDFERYVIAPYEDEYVYPYRVGQDLTDVSAFAHEPRITGRFRQTPEGYEYELRLPLEMLGEKLGLALFDVDDPGQREVAAIVATASLDSAADLGSLRRPTPEIDRIVAGMGHTNSMVRVIDRSQRVLLSTGDLETASGLELMQEDEPGTGLWQWVKTNLLAGLYDWLLAQPTYDFVEELYLNGTLEGEHVISALIGTPQSGFRTMEDGITRILEAAWPIRVNQQVLGAVVVDQNMNGIRTFRNQALETLFDTMLGILLLTVGALFIFATLLSSRIRSLRNQAERVIDEKGRLANKIVPSRSDDEIGDLSRSFASIVERLGQYTHYLENMSSRLSHELRTPVTVVRSSLENLRFLSQDEEAGIYLQRAEEGISRLNLILTNMSEAARLEQILQSSDREVTELNRVIEAGVNEYRQIYPDTRFTTEISREPVLIMGTAEYIAQLMDKVVANAVDFALPGTPVHVVCREDNGEALVTVSNQGPCLEPQMKDRVFDSMVSVRPETKKKQPHLGMGLHIARMITDYHSGTIFADNLMDASGVIVVVRIPLHV
jgi:dedicated sortase system histidine kinase